MATIIIDAGHGGFDNGATFNGRNEKTDALNLALAVGEDLERLGQDVLYTRTNDVYQNPNEKARIANESNADFFVSIHRNSSPFPDTYEGVETLLYDNSGIKATMAANINKNLENLGFENLGVEERKDLAVLRRTRMPALLVEAGFINTEDDNELFDEKFDEIANAIATGIVETLRNDSTPPVPNRPQMPSDVSYGIQVGLFRNPDNAKALENQLQQDGFNATIIPIQNYNGVVVGPVSTFRQARETESLLERRGYETLIITL